MRKIPPKLLQDILNDPYYAKCIRHKEGQCKGRITLEHAIIYGGKQVNDKWAILPVCAYHHAVDEFQDNGDVDKDYHEYVALSRTTIREVSDKYPKRDWEQRWRYLESKYGERE